MSYTQRRCALITFAALLIAPLSLSADPIPAKQSAALPTQPAVEFLDVEAGRRAILDDSAQPYFKLLQPAEMSSITGRLITGDSLEEQRAECRRRLQAGVRAFAADEQEAIRRLIGEVYPTLATQYPRFARTPWSFIQIESTLEGGMPHTRGAHIIMPTGVCRAMVGAAARKRAAARSTVYEILVHEQMHVFQRAHPGFYDTLFTDVLGYEFCPRLKLHPYLVEHWLTNPDATDCRWILTLRRDDGVRHILPLIMLNEGEGLRQIPLQARQVAVYLKKNADGYEPWTKTDGQPYLRALESVPEVTRRFGQTFNAYHPLEACADVFANLLVAEMDDPTPMDNADRDAAQDDTPIRADEDADREEVYAQARRWFRKQLAEPASRPAVEAPRRTRSRTLEPVH